MNTRTWIAALIAVAATGLAGAGENAEAAAGQNSQQAQEGAAPERAGLTRAQVTAAFLAARRQGQIPETEADYDVAQTRKHQAKRG
jgi:hypothetical protein